MRWHVLAFVLMSAAAHAQPAKVLSLEAAQSIGRENSRVLRISAVRSESERARAAEVDAARYPGFFLSGSYSRIQEGQFRLSAPSFPVPLPVGSVVENNYAFRVGLRQPIFTGFRLVNSAEAADLLADASLSDHRMQESELVMRITSAYWSLYQARRVVTFAAENVRRLGSYRDDTRRLMEAGLATQNDLLKVDVQLSNAKISQINARDDAYLAEMNLNNLIGQPMETALELSSRPDQMSAGDSALLAPGDFDRLVTAALESRQDLAATSARTEAAGAGVRAARGNWWPQVELTATYSYSRPNARYQPVTDEFLGSWDVGVSLYLEMWNWGATARRVEQAEALLKQNELQQAQLKENIVLEVNRANLSVRRASEKLAVAKLAVEQAEENRRMTSDRYRNGLATSSELLDAEVSLLQAQTQFTAAQVESALARADLGRAAGQR